ncbi:hypothetical protein TrRE_jg3731, partial [Triparma retinervis]
MTSSSKADAAAAFEDHPWDLPNQEDQGERGGGVDAAADDFTEAKFIHTKSAYDLDNSTLTNDRSTASFAPDISSITAAPTPAKKRGGLTAQELADLDSEEDDEDEDEDDDEGGSDNAEASPSSPIQGEGASDSEDYNTTDGGEGDNGTQFKLALSTASSLQNQLNQAHHQIETLLTKLVASRNNAKQLKQTLAVQKQQSADAISKMQSDSRILVAAAHEAAAATQQKLSLEQSSKLSACLAENDKLNVENLRSDLDENRKETKDLEEARKSQSSSQQNLIGHLTSQVAKMKLKSEQGEKGLRKMVMVGKKELKECRLELKASREKMKKLQQSLTKSRQDCKNATEQRSNLTSQLRTERSELKTLRLDIAEVSAKRVKLSEILKAYKKSEDEREKKWRGRESEFKSRLVAEKATSSLKSAVKENQVKMVLGRCLMKLKISASEAKRHSGTGGGEEGEEEKKQEEKCKGKGEGGGEGGEEEDGGLGSLKAIANKIEDAVDMFLHAHHT